MILQNVERKICQVEGFKKVDFIQNGVNVRGDLEGIPPYTFARAAPDKMTAKEWVDARFSRLYPGYSVRITDHNGMVVTSMQTLLATIRGK